MLLNDTESWIKYDIDPTTTSMSSAGGVNHIILGLDLSTYGNPDLAQDGTIADNESVCVSFDLFRRKKDVINPGTPEGGVVLASASSASSPLQATDNIVILNDGTNDNISVNGVGYYKTVEVTGINSTQNILTSIDETDTTGAIIDYLVIRTDSAGQRTGQIMASFKAGTVATTDTSTRDIGSSTAGCSLDVQSSGGLASVRAVITGGTYTVIIYFRALGAYS